MAWWILVKGKIDAKAFCCDFHLDVLSELLDIEEKCYALLVKVSDGTIQKGCQCLWEVEQGAGFV